MMQTAAATRSDLPALTVLWQTCFGDKPAEIRKFWDALFPHIRVFLMRDGTRPVAMVCALPVTLTDTDGEGYPAVYFYALCTAPQFRGKGIAKQLLRFAEASVQKDGAQFAALVPAEVSLFSYYQALGYRTSCYRQEASVSASNVSGTVSPLSPEGYYALRELSMQGGFISYGLPLLRYQQEALYRVETAGDVCCALARKENTQLVVQELIPFVPEAAALLAQQLGCTDAVVCGPGGTKPFGMMKSLCELSVPERVYLGIAFD